ncbi:aminotransferase class V-fold PLP-dependent enzyme [uncultured Treponema sp.]|uniref:aminotransferase class V-fold PLP-dependent enzyme n=1 Tax=uncultured Treponema sp. TaxID=162155 RepID=UPI0025F7A352|nr:aminotransferase class V-fold PLP-dependent enzyme [uncultured Treponema sp.]
MAYFDNAATTFPKPQCVYDFMDSFYRNNGGSAGRGSHALSLTAGKLISDTRKHLQEILHCQNKEIIFTPTATIALNMILQGVLASTTLSKRNRNADGERSRTVYTSPFEHNAVTRVLNHFEQNESIKVNVLPVQKNLSYDFTEIESLFKKDKPDLLVVSHASNVIGLVQPVEKLCLLAKKFDCVTVLDMAQTAGLVDLNVGLETVDFAVFAGHKTLYGPTGISGFAMKAGFDLSPVLFGGTGYESANQDMPKDIPQRYEMGTLNISGVAGLYASTGWILETGIESIWMKEQEHRKCLLEILRKYDFVKVVGNCHTDSRFLTKSQYLEQEVKYAGIVSCLIEGVPSDTAASVFSEQNIAVRSGLQCAPLAHKTLGTFPAGTVRFSTSYLTGEEDFLELEKAMEWIRENI